MAELIEWCFEHVSYWTVAFFMALENSLVPFPSEAIVPPAGYKAAAGEMSFLLVVVFATLGADVGASINYAIARWLGRPFVYKFANSRLGKLCLVSEEKIRRAEAFFEKYGAAATLTGRLVPVVRQFIPFPAGLARMRYSSFLLYTTVGAGLWNTVLAAIGYYLHAFVSKDELLPKVYEYSHAIGSCAAAAAVVGAAVFFARLHFKNLKKNRKGDKLP